ncbi:MAG: hypothetical protein ACFCUU_09320 [Cyclobacteriaceae bacterium]
MGIIILCTGCDPNNKHAYEHLKAALGVKNDITHNAHYSTVTYEELMRKLVKYEEDVFVLKDEKQERAMYRGDLYDRMIGKLDNKLFLLESKTSEFKMADAEKKREVIEEFELIEGQIVRRIDYLKDTFKK